MPKTARLVFTQTEVNREAKDCHPTDEFLCRVGARMITVTRDGTPTSHYPRNIRALVEAEEEYATDTGEIADIWRDCTVDAQGTITILG